MRVIVGCEESQTVTKAFRSIGVEAYSCDIQECSGGHPDWHFQEDIFEVLKRERFDLGIFHPPCQYLTYAGMGNWYDDGRAMKRIDAAKFFMRLYDCNINHVCVENPQGIMSKIFREPDMSIHPYFFGEQAMKRTQLWLKNLPKLEYHLEDNLFSRRTSTDKPAPLQIQLCKKTGRLKKRYDTDCFVVNRLKTSKEKSKTYESIARAMAEQWTEYIKNQAEQHCGNPRVAVPPERSDYPHQSEEQEATMR